MTRYAAIIGLSIGVTCAAISGSKPAAAYIYEIVLAEGGLIQQGREALRSGRIERAIYRYKAALERNLSDRDFQVAHSDLCVAYYLHRDYDLALQHCNEAIDLAPNQWTAFNNRANVYLEVGQFELALADYARGLQLNPSSRVIAENQEIAAAMILESRDNKVGPEGVSATVEPDLQAVLDEG